MKRYVSLALIILVTLQVLLTGCLEDTSDRMKKGTEIPAEILPPASVSSDGADGDVFYLSEALLYD